MQNVLIILMLSVCVLSLIHSPCLANTGSRIAQQNRPLTMGQIEKLIDVPTPDSAIAGEIDKLSVDFDVNEDVVERFRKLGAGRLTLAAILRQKNKPHPPTSKILVADFRGVNNENIGLYELLLQQLRDSVGAYTDVQIEPLGKPITAEQGREVAVKEGREHNASIVLWGWFVKSPAEGLVNAYIEILRSPQVFSWAASTRRDYKASVNEINQFTLQAKLSKDLTSIALAVTALARLDLLDYQGAISRLTDALNLGAGELVDSSYLYTFRALAYFYEAVDSGGDTLPQAILDTDQAIKLNDKNTGASLLRAYLFLTKGDIERAISEGHELLQRMETPSDKAGVYEFLLNALTRRGSSAQDANNKQILAYCKEILAVTDKPTVPSAQIFWLRAKAFDQLMDDREAIASLKMAQNLRPDNILKANIHFLLGSILQRRGHYAESLKEFRNVLQSDPKWFNAYVQLGNILYWMKQYPESIDNYNKAIKLAPRDTVQYNNRANAYRDLGDSEKALTDYAKSIELAPSNDVAYYDRANLYYSKQQVDDALRDLNKCIESNPDQIDAFYLRAEINFSKKLYDASIEDYTAIIEHNRQSSDAFFFRANSEHYKGSLDRALEDYDQSIVLSPRYAAAYLGRGVLYASRANRKEAIADLTHAIEYAENPEARQRAQQELTKLHPKK